MPTVVRQIAADAVVKCFNPSWLQVDDASGRLFPTSRPGWRMAKTDQRNVRSVLIIEPVLRFRSGLEATLQQQGYRVICSDGETLGNLETESPDVVLLSCDASMKGLDGFGICALIVRNQLAPAVVMSSPKPTKQIVLTSARMGARGFVVMPPGIYTLREQLERAYSGTTEAKADSQFPVIDFGERHLTDTQKVDVIMKSASSIRALPHAVTTVLRTTSMDNTGAKDITKAAESDPTVAAMILKRANSSYYGGSRSIGDLQSAVVRLGFKECRQLVVGISVVNLFSKGDQSFGFNRIWYWLHSMGCALVAKRIAERSRVPGAEDAFTVGLLHDIGKVVLDDFLNAPFQKIVRLAHTENCSLYDAEQKVLQRDHAQVGSAVMHRWQFPLPICQAVESHHDYATLLESERLELPLIIHVANQITKALLVGAGGDFIVQEIPIQLWQRCGFGESIDDTFLDEFYEELRDFCAFLQIREKDIEQALDRRSGSGTAVIVAPDDVSTAVLRLFLVNQGFVVELLSDPSLLSDREEPPELCLLRPADAQGARPLVEQVEGQPQTIPTVCIVPQKVAKEEWMEGRDWLRVFTMPVECFNLACGIRELLPDHGAPTFGREASDAVASAE